MTTTKTTSSAAASLGIGAAAGIIAGALIALATQLSPLAAQDRNALSLIAISLSLPLGVMLAFGVRDSRGARVVALRAVAAALGMSLALSIVDTRLFAGLLVWLVPAMLIGACVGALDRRGVAGFIAVACWLALCALPFYCQVFDQTRFEEVSRQWAMQGCPWMGFVQGALGADQPIDPLRRSVIYMGHWSTLTGMPAEGLLTSGTLWWCAALALGNLLARAWSVERGARRRNG